MKFFRKKRNKDANKQLDKTRSVVFIERTYKSFNSNKISRRRPFIFTFWRKIRLPNAVKKLFLVIVLISVAILIAYGLLNLTTNSSGFTSPLPNGFAQAKLTEVDKKIVDELKREGIEVRKIDSSIPSEYHIFLKDNGEVILSSEKDLAEQIDSLQFILNRLTMEGRSSFIKLDLRFERPVVVPK